MRETIEALERLNAALAEVDPGDQVAVGRLIVERGAWIARLAGETKRGYGGADAEELKRRLEGVACGMAQPYRALTLHKLLLQHRLAKSGQGRAVLAAFSPEQPAAVGAVLATDV